MATTQHRIVALLPSASETVCAAGCEDLLVGRSHECDFPPSIQHLPVLTAAKTAKFTTSRDIHDATCAALEAGIGLYTVDAQLLEQLRPSLVVTQDLCSVCSVDLRVVSHVLQQSKLDPKPSVLSLNPASLEDVLVDILRVGHHVGRLDTARAAVAALRARLASITRCAAQFGPPKLRNAVFLEWTDPLFCGGHWTPALIELVGGTHPLNLPQRRSPAASQALGGAGTEATDGEQQGEEEEAVAGLMAAARAAAGPSFVTSPEALVASDPDIIIICPCGLDLEVGRREAWAMARNSWWRELRAVQRGAVFLVDGNAHFNRPGPRLLDAAEFLLGVLHERWELIPPGFEFELLQVADPADPEQPPTAAALGPGMEDGASQLQGNDAPSRKAHGSRNVSRHMGAHATPSTGAAQANDEAQQEGGEEDVLACAAREPPPGTHCAPQLLADVEECYHAALQAGRQQYRDPLSGFQCFTELALRAGRSCCGNRCRHCPQGHFRVNPGRRGPRVNRITDPVVMPGGSASSHWRRVTLLVVVAPVSGGAPLDALLAQAERRVQELQALAAPGCGVMTLVAVDPCTRAMWCMPEGPGASDAVEPLTAEPLSAWMDFCTTNKQLSMVAVPVRVAHAALARDSHAALVRGVVEQAQAVLAAQAGGAKVQGLAWVDEAAEHLPWMPWLPVALHSWRQATASSSAHGWAEVKCGLKLAE